MVEADARTISARLRERGICFSELSCRDGALIIGLSDDITVEAIAFIGVFVEALGFKGARIKSKGSVFYLEFE
jgi:hypothetical protein